MATQPRHRFWWLLLKFCTLLLSLGATTPAQIPHRAMDLLEQSRCGCCHDAGALQNQEFRLRRAPLLGRETSKLNPEGVRRLLLAPRSGMPDMLHHLDSNARKDAIDHLVAFLCQDSGEPPPPDSPLPPARIERGRQLFHTVGCVPCHGPLEKPYELEVPFWAQDEISDSLRRFHDSQGLPAEPEGNDWLPEVPIHLRTGDLTVKHLAERLRLPRDHHPDALMPDLMLSKEESESIAAYLLLQSATFTLEEQQGLQYRLFHHRNPTPDPRLDDLKPDVVGVMKDVGLPDHPGDHFLVELTGSVRIDQDGPHRFFLTSDDGSRLFLGGKLVIQNDGLHPPKTKDATVDLEAGKQELRITFFEATGGEELSLSWEEPGGRRQPIPPERFTHRTVVMHRSPLEARHTRGDAETGAQLFTSLSCVTCHTNDAQPTTTPPLDQLAAATGSACIGPEPQAGLPEYSFSDEERELIQQALTVCAAPPVEPDPQERLHRSLRRLRCYSCHTRDNHGGPHPRLRPYFQASVADETGDKERFPPSLTGVGRKLKLDFLRSVILADGRSHAYLETRMPRYPHREVARLPDTLATLDRAVERNPQPKPTLSDLDAGTELLGIGGLGCIRCHEFQGNPSLGIPGADLATITQRIRYPWFRDFLRDPKSVLPSTRMPQFFDVHGKSTAKELLAGDASRQIDALWNTLKLGASIPPPPGLKTPDSAFEVNPTDRVRMVSVFMKDVGPRVLLVGFPEHVHFAYDVGAGRLVRAWRGRFFNARGTWHNRAGRLEDPGGDHRLSWPKGIPVAQLRNPNEAWPEVSTGRDAKKLDTHSPDHRVLGRTLSPTGIPTFRNVYFGRPTEETLRPIQVDGRLGLERKLEPEATGNESPERTWYWRVYQGVKVERLDDGFLVDGVHVRSTERMVVVPRTADHNDILIPIDDQHRILKVELLW